MRAGRTRQGQPVLGLGYPTPISACFARMERCIAIMPAAQGVLKWPTARPTLATLVDEFSAAAAGCRCRSHPLGSCAGNVRRSEGLLREVWRVLAPSGRMRRLFPTGAGLDPHRHHPFGHGRPYSRSQITHFAEADLVHADGVGRSAVMPPVAGGWFLRSAMAWERRRAALSLPFAGVHNRGSHQAGLSRDSRAPRTHPADSGAGAALVPSSTATG